MKTVFSSRAFRWMMLASSAIIFNGVNLTPTLAMINPQDSTQDETETQNSESKQRAKAERIWQAVKDARFEEGVKRLVRNPTDCNDVYRSYSSRFDLPDDPTHVNSKVSLEVLQAYLPGMSFINSWTFRTYLPKDKANFKIIFPYLPQNLKTLELNHFAIDPDDFEAIKSLPQYKELHSLTFDESPLLSNPQNVALLSDALKNALSIRQLTFSMDEFTDESILKLQHIPPSTKELFLTAPKLTKDVGTHIAGLIKGKPLESLALYRMHLEAEGLSAILGNLSPSIVSLSVEGNPLGDAAVATLANHLPRLVNLKTLNIANIGLGNTGADVLWEILPDTSVEELKGIFSNEVSEPYDINPPRNKDGVEIKIHSRQRT